MTLWILLCVVIPFFLGVIIATYTKNKGKDHWWVYTLCFGVGLLLGYVQGALYA